MQQSVELKTVIIRKHVIRKMEKFDLFQLDSQRIDDDVFAPRDITREYELNCKTLEKYTL